MDVTSIFEELPNILSTSFFQNLRFTDTPTFSLPPRLPLNSILRFVWVQSLSDLPNELRNRKSTGDRVLSEPAVPQLGDLAPILNEQSRQEKNGALGVVVELLSGQQSVYSFWSCQEVCQLHPFPMEY